MKTIGGQYAVLALASFREQARAIDAWREHEFPVGTFVRVDKGNTGVVVEAYGVNRPAQVGVMFCNGNVWCREVEQLTRIPGRELCWEMRRMWLQRRGYRVLSGRPRGVLP
jgi:hypothetical protein